MVMKWTHYIGLSQVVSIPAGHLCLLLVLREATGSHRPWTAIPDMRKRQTLLSQNMWAFITWWLPEDSRYRAVLDVILMCHKKCCFSIVISSVWYERFPFMSFGWQRGEFINGTGSLSLQKMSTNTPPLETTGFWQLHGDLQHSIWLQKGKNQFSPIMEQSNRENEEPPEKCSCKCWNKS